MPYKFSPSSLNLLKECHRCFWLHFNKNIRRPQGIFPSLPGGMDRTMKEHFDKYMRKGELPPELKELDEHVKLFDDEKLLNEWRNNRKGVRWEYNDGTILRGAVDNILVLKKDGKLIVLDYKTRGYPLKEDTAGHYQDQLDIYYYLLQKNGQKVENYGYLLFYYPLEVDEKGHVVFETKLVKMHIDIKNAENILQKALDLLKKEIPTQSKECDYCGWAINYNS